MSNSQTEESTTVCMVGLRSDRSEQVASSHIILSVSSSSSDESACNPGASLEELVTVEEQVSGSNQGEMSDGKAWYYTKEEIRYFFVSKNAQFDAEDIEELLKESPEVLCEKLRITDVRTVCGTIYYEINPESYVTMPLITINKCFACLLCGGYLIDVVTMSICQHNFCKFCLELATYNPALCPLCEQTGDGEGYMQKRILNEGLSNLVYTCFPALKGYRHEDQHAPRKLHMQEKVYLRPSIRMTGRGYGTIKFKLNGDTTLAQVAIYLNNNIENLDEGAKLKITRYGEDVNPFKTVEEIELESCNGQELVFDYEIY